MSSVKLNPKEYITDLIETGMSREEAIQIVKSEIRKRRRYSRENDVKMENDYRMNARRFHPNSYYSLRKQNHV